MDKFKNHRHAPNAGPRKSWAAGDATEAMQLVWLTKKGCTDILAISAPTWALKMFYSKEMN